MNNYWTEEEKAIKNINEISFNEKVDQMNLGRQLQFLKDKQVHENILNNLVPMICLRCNKLFSNYTARCDVCHDLLHWQRPEWDKNHYEQKLKDLKESIERIIRYCPNLSPQESKRLSEQIEKEFEK